MTGRDPRHHVRSGSRGPSVGSALRRSHPPLLISAAVLLVVGGALSAADAESHRVSMKVGHTAMVAAGAPVVRSLFLRDGLAEGLRQPRIEHSAVGLLHYTSVNGWRGERAITVTMPAHGRGAASDLVDLRVTYIPSGCGESRDSGVGSLSSTVIVAAIGSCATGDAGRGVEITYTLAVDEVALAGTGGAELLCVLFTIVDVS